MPKIPICIVRLLNRTLPARNVSFNHTIKCSKLILFQSIETCDIYLQKFKSIYYYSPFDITFSIYLVTVAI